MVYYRENHSERAPLSLILPHLYLGAETDVTQDCLSDRGISYVLSVSRSCPQPSFLPQSRYLRIPIDDSLRDDLLPWIPQALRFIDEASSLGCSVLVHCAAGISRSPALAVAYVMYSKKLDLDQAYRFVKERRPTISPNFNFLGQLQLFQATLSLKNNNTNQHNQQSANPVENCLQATNDKLNSSSAASLLTNLNLQINKESNCIIHGQAEDSKSNVHCENKNKASEATQSRSKQCEVMKPEFTLSLSSSLKALSLQTNPEVQRPASQTQQNPSKSIPSKPTFLQLPVNCVSLAEKRKSLTLSLSPVSAVPDIHQEGSTEHRVDQKSSTALSSAADQKGETHALEKVDAKASATKTESKATNRFPRREASSRPNCVRSHRRKSKANKNQLGRAKESQPKTNLPGPENNSIKKAHKIIQSQCDTAKYHCDRFQRQVTGGVEAVEGMMADHSPLSPVSLTVNKILDWGERLLLGVIVGPRIKVGQAALQYRC